MKAVREGHVLAATRPTGAAWRHEIKHDGFSVIARKHEGRVRLYSCPGNDLTYRFPLIVEALAACGRAPASFDGEAVSCGDDGGGSLRSHCAQEIGGNISAWFDAVVCDGDI
jgi:bifunctional non-homologous end joining protein LigD